MNIRTELENSINGAKKLISDQISKNPRGIYFGPEHTFSEYSKFYIFTNEAISAYLDLVSFEGKNRSLSVCASGDHAFNLINKGITQIDTFDINRLTKYYALGFKRAMILKYSYKEFIQIYEKLTYRETTIDEISDIIEGLLSYMESEDKIFWQNILDYNYQLQRNCSTNMNLILILTRDELASMYYNNYMSSEESYELLRSKIASVNISFTHCNAINLPKIFLEKYDFILLSNILDYVDREWGFWTYKELKKYEKNLEKRMKHDGVIFLHYCIGYKYNKTSEYLPIADGSNTSISDLTDEEIYPLQTNGRKASIILKRKKERN